MSREIRRQKQSRREFLGLFSSGLLGAAGGVGTGAVVDTLSVLAERRMRSIERLSGTPDYAKYGVSVFINNKSPNIKVNPEAVLDTIVISAELTNTLTQTLDFLIPNGLLIDVADTSVYASTPSYIPIPPTLQIPTSHVDETLANNSHVSSQRDILRSTVMLMREASGEDIRAPERFGGSITSGTAMGTALTAGMFGLTSEGERSVVDRGRIVVAGALIGAVVGGVVFGLHHVADAFLQGQQNDPVIESLINHPRIQRIQGQYFQKVA